MLGVAALGVAEILALAVFVMWHERQPPVKPYKDKSGQSFFPVPGSNVKQK
jgi:hypothetical protein